MVQILKSGPNSMIFNAKSNLARENAVRFGLGGATGFTLPFLHMTWGTCSQTEDHKYQLYCNQVGACVLKRRRIVPSFILNRICCKNLDHVGFFGLWSQKFVRWKKIFRSKNRIFIFCSWVAENFHISSFYGSKSISDVKITVVRVVGVLWWFFAIELKGPIGKYNLVSTGFPPAS